jgi:hypothetical protein
MSTIAQITANQTNAQASTGPRTQEGKANSSRNATKLGLFSGDYVRPDEQSLYDELNDSILRELAPAGILELNLASEIRRAMWRLRRCGEVEAALVSKFEHVDPMEASDKLMEHTQKSVDRARSQAHRLLHKCTAELRRLQTERQFRRLTLTEAEAAEFGLANNKVIVRARTQFAKQTHSNIAEMGSIGKIAKRSQFEVPQAA